MRARTHIVFPGLVLGLSLVLIFIFQATAAAADEGSLIDLVNQERQANGLAPLSYSSDLSNAASLQAQENAACQCASHAGQHYASAENVSVSTSASDAFQQWLGSAQHHANMLNPSYTGIGVGYANDGNGTGYYVLNFA
ncbi:MAG: CAP domain-containing protein [Rubrobacter sp.]|nr:CAP domain-containing protein [Rubrobacter sp.]